MPVSNQPFALPHGTQQTTGLKIGDVYGAILGRDDKGNRTLSILTSVGWIDIPATNENIIYLVGIGRAPHVAEGVSLGASPSPDVAAKGNLT